MQIDILENGYSVDGKMFSHPVKIDDLKQHLGSGRFFEEERKDGSDQYTYTVVVWDDLGLYATLKAPDNSAEKNIAWRLTAAMKENASKKGDCPYKVFSGRINVQGRELGEIKIKRDDWFGEYVLGENRIDISFDEGEIKKVSICSQRRQAEGKHGLNVDIQDSGICINGELFGYPLDLMAIRKCVAVNPDEICEEDKDFDNGFTIGLDYNGKRRVGIDFFYFDGKLTINGKDYLKAKKKKDRYGFSAEGIYGDSKVYYSLKHSDGSIKYLSITQFNSALIEKYKMKQTNEEVLTFKDINFKLLVIDELMYEKELLQPKFDIYEFAEQYQKRDIDTGSEEPIKEALDYFRNYPVEKRFAEEITELTQDGNEIYMNIAPQWDGEDSAFDIKSAQDAQQFPNLKKVTLASDNFSKLSKQFEKLGIKAEQL